jgi:hypothetical protein
MMALSSRRCPSLKNEKGSALIEFVLLAPLIVLLIMFVLFAGWWSYTKLSSQNAAYSRGISNPSYAAFRSAGSFVSKEETAEWIILESSQGMKRMWVDYTTMGWPHSQYEISRIGGIGYVVSISPSNISWMDWIKQAVELLATGESTSRLPKGNSFFFFTPFISEAANEY